MLYDIEKNYKIDMQSKGNILTETSLKQNNIAYQLRLKANEYRKISSYKEAVKEYLNAVLIDNNDFESLLGLGISYKYLNQTEKAIKTLEKAALLNKENAEVFYELGICLLINGQICPAMHSLVKSLQIDKTNVNAQLQLAIAHEALEEYDMALTIYRKIIETNPSYVKAYEHEAFLLTELRRYKEAGAVFKKLLRVFPECNHANMGIGVCFEKLNKNLQARRYYKQFLQNAKDETEISLVKTKLKNLDVTYPKRNNTLSLVV